MTEVDDALTLAQRIDGFFEVAARKSFSVYGEGAQEVFEELYSLTPFKGAEFVEAYRAGGIYPDERLTELELLDRTLIWNPHHLLRALREFEDFYNTHRPTAA